MATTSANPYFKSKGNKLLIVGSVAYDGIETPFAKAKKTLGGSATYFSLASSKFSPTSIVAVVGEDFKDLNVLRSHGVDVSRVKKTKGKTFYWAGKYSFDLNSRQTLKTELGVLSDFNPVLSPAQTNADYVFLANTSPKIQLDVLSQLKHPKFVGLDTMNYWMETALPDLKKVLQKVNILIINDSEARQLSKEHNLVKAAKKILAIMNHSPLAPSASSLIIKQGEYGLLMFQKNKTFNLPGYLLEDVVDPTGAGDAFAGGFFGYLAKTSDTSWNNLKRACVYGSAAASFCVEKLGTKKLLEIGKWEIERRQKELKRLTS